jgi:nitrogenase-associated protein
MATVIFYEKPGCGNNTKQKALLAAAGHEIVACNLLTELWTAERLLEFFGQRPVAEWFNRAAPRVKSGEIVPENLNAETALELMLQDALLICRPLIEANGRKEAGFDQERIQNWIGLTPSTTNLESCPRSHAHTPCPVLPEAAH